MTMIVKCGICRERIRSRKWAEHEGDHLTLWRSYVRVMKTWTLEKKYKQMTKMNIPKFTNKFKLKKWKLETLINEIVGVKEPDNFLGLRKKKSTDK